jgi:AcrR family transcriptional regulator
MPKVVPEYKAQARQRIIDAARQVFRRKGLRNATMDDVAKEVGVSKGAIYLYFRTKAELLVHIQDQSRSEILRTWEKLLTEGDIAEGIAHSLDEVFSGTIDPAIWHELLAESATNPDIRDALIKDRKGDVRLMRRFLRQLEERGRIPKMGNPTAVSEIILTLLEGTVVRMMLEGRESEARGKLVRELRLVLALG